jgi:hypothetical protein
VTEFEKSWLGADLGHYRPCDGTYQLYPYDSLPPLDEAQFTGAFDWLRPDSPALTADPFAEHRPGKRAFDTTALAASLAPAGLTLPPAFVTFMGDADLQAQVPSCTACEWDLAEAAVPSPVEDGAYLIRFLRDQQDVAFWYLNLTPTAAAVVCSPILFGDIDLTGRDDEVVANTWWSAPHFEQFVYRFWIENTLWFNLDGGEADLTPEERAYLNHYSPAL